MVSFPQVTPTKFLYTPLLSPVRATCPAHLILLYFITRTIFGEQYRSLSPSLRSFLHSPVTPSLLGSNIPLNILSLRSSLNVSDQFSHPYKTTGEIIILYVLVGGMGVTVVKVLCYKSEGRWFDPKWCHWKFSLT